MSALFRLLEAHEGAIAIDADEVAGGGAIAQIGLTELRSKLA